MLFHVMSFSKMVISFQGRHGLVRTTDKSALDVSKLDFDNVAQMKKIHLSHTVCGLGARNSQSIWWTTKECLSYKAKLRKQSLGICLGDIGAPRVCGKQRLAAWCVICRISGVGPTMAKNQWFRRARIFSGGRDGLDDWAKWSAARRLIQIWKPVGPV